MNPTKEELVKYLKELTLMVRDGESREEMERSVLEMGKFAEKSFLSKELLAFLKDKEVHRDGMFVL